MTDLPQVEVQVVKLNAEVDLYGLSDVLLDQCDIRRDLPQVEVQVVKLNAEVGLYSFRDVFLDQWDMRSD